ncbi:hypothetical protein QCA50_018875 [Cerrena zonata]|uniref:Uncharacterized protein n=1 Tax=Cerrena zonata TaxID=2478898 RepID=A0AAW0FDC4_9APHY
MAYLGVDDSDEDLMQVGDNPNHIRILTRELWPEDIPYYVGKPLRVTDVKSSDLIPLKPEHLYDWARVVNNPHPMDRTRGRALILVNPSRPRMLEQVAIKVQGFVEARGLSLETLGNWDGEASTAMAARQTLALHGGAYPEVFKMQQRALRALVNYAALHVGVPTSFKASNDRLELERPVFTRARGCKKAPLTLSNADDPTHRSDAVKDQWIVTERLGIGRRLDESNQIVAANPFAIRPGDFVEATITLDISIRGLRDRKGYIRFWVSRVARICRKEQVPKASRAPKPPPTVSTQPGLATMGDDVQWPADNE